MSQFIRKERIGKGRKCGLVTSGLILTAILGEPIPYPHDDKKVDFTWGSELEGSPSDYVSVWNYCDGQKVGVEFDMEKEREFSLYFSSPEAFDLLVDLIEFAEYVENMEG